MKIAIYPGSFDPIHDGHLQVVNKATKIFNLIYVVVTNNINKNHFVDIEQRFKKVESIFKNNHKVIVLKNENELTANFAKKINASFLIRGVRNERDFKYEIDLANANKFLNNNLETIIFISDEKNKKISSTLINEIEKYKK